MKVTCMPLACFVFWFFTVNAFQFLYLGIRTHSSILIVALNGCISSWKNVIFFWKMFLLKLNFQDEDHLYANCLFHILPLYCKCFLSQFLIGGIRMHIRILRGVLSLAKKRWFFAENSLFWILIDKLEANCMRMSQFLTIFDNLNKSLIFQMVTNLSVSYLILLINKLVSTRMLYLKLYFNASLVALNYTIKALRSY